MTREDQYLILQKSCLWGGTLRELIKFAIESQKTSEDQAMAVCIALEPRLGLSENGWFDDDELLLNGTPDGDGEEEVKQG